MILTQAGRATENFTEPIFFVLQETNKTGFEGCVGDHNRNIFVCIKRSRLENIFKDIWSCK
jgi:hypothetical protein